MTTPIWLPLTLSDGHWFVKTWGITSGRNLITLAPEQPVRLRRQSEMAQETRCDHLTRFSRAGISVFLPHEDPR